MSLNLCVFVGRLGKPIELKTTPSNKQVASFSIAIDSKRGGNPQETEWINCVAWEQSATFLDKYSQKGSLLQVTGEWKTRSWEGQNGQKMYKTECLVQSCKILHGWKKDDVQSNQPMDNYDDNLPF
jgi:single-strand DNA-binding protein